MEQSSEAQGLGAQTVYRHRQYLVWSGSEGLDPDDTATATAYEDWWREDHGVPPHHCTGDELGYCDVCRA